MGQIFMWAVKVQIATYLDTHTAWGVPAEICGSAKKIKQNKTFLMYREELSSPTLQFPCSFFLPFLFLPLRKPVPSSQVPTARAKLMH